MATALRAGRRIQGSAQQEAADRSGISQARWSELERGLGAGATLETWAIAAAAVGLQLAAFLEGAPGATAPRDIEHARRQSALIELAASGGWRALPELAVDLTIRSRSVDVALLRDTRREAAAFEIWDWFDDVGASFRGLDAKKQVFGERLARLTGDSTSVTGVTDVTGVAGVAGRAGLTGGIGATGPRAVAGTTSARGAAGTTSARAMTGASGSTGARGPTGATDAAGAIGGTWRVAACFVVRDTARNRWLVDALRPLFVARFPGSSAGWLAALRDPTTRMPTEDGFLWSDREGRLSGSHLRRR